MKRINKKRDSFSVLLIVTGSIAADKSVDIVKLLQESKVFVDILMSRSSERFVSSVQFEILTGRSVYKESSESENLMVHIDLTRNADLVLVAPATANFIGKLANGIADDLVSTTALASDKRLIIAPAMNCCMYENRAVMRNVDLLRSDGVEFIGPDTGLLACGEEGIGRLSDPVKIVEKVLNLLSSSDRLKGKRFLVTAGSLREEIDDVRYIANRSSGKMGLSIAAELVRRSAEVILIAGSLTEPVPYGLKESLIVKDSSEMESLILSKIDSIDAFVLAAAVTDIKPKKKVKGKIKKENLDRIDLVKTNDLAAMIGKMKSEKSFSIGFAAETRDHKENAIKKMEDKNFDMIALNDVSRSDIGFGSDYNEIEILFKDGRSVFLKRDLKSKIASSLVDEIEKLWF